MKIYGYFKAFFFPLGLQTNPGDSAKAGAVLGTGSCTHYILKKSQPLQWQPTPVLLPGKFHGQRSLVGYSPWDHKESDTTVQLTNYP